MATLSSDGKSVTVVRGDTLSEIAEKYLGSASKHKQLAAINNIKNPDLIYVGQVIKLYANSSSGGGGSTASSSKPATTKPKVTQFGEMANDEGTLFATWDWDRSNTESYKVLWTYDNGNGVWFVGSDTTISVNEDAQFASKQSTYSVPANARRVQFRVKPISKKYTKNDKETSYWTSDWSTVLTWTDATPLTAPGVPTVEIKKYKLTADLTNISITGATQIEFQVVKEGTNFIFRSGKADIVTTDASIAFTVDAGFEYKVRCRAIGGGLYSDWSEFSDNVATIPAAPAEITVCRSSSKTSVYLEWKAAGSAKTYEIEYATKKEYFDMSNQTSTQSGIELTKYDLGGLETGHEYFFRVRAVNTAGNSPWSGIKSTVIGKKPAAPTTWQSTTTAITGEPLKLYWMHNSADGSREKYAELEIYVGDVKTTRTVQNTTPEDEDVENGEYSIDTSSYPEGTKIQWRVRTSGVTMEYGDWSVQRVIDVYAPPTVELVMINADGNVLTSLESFPFYVRALTGPETQAPIGYYLSIVANDTYETVDNIGNPVTVKAGDMVYSKWFDITTSLMVEMSAHNLNLENGANYSIICTASLDSGLTATASVTFDVAWAESQYSPNAEISIDEDTYTSYVRPYCDQVEVTTYQVTHSNGVYALTETVLGGVYGEPVSGATLTTGEQVYSGVTDEDVEVYYAIVETSTPVENVFLAVYRRQFDGSFVEIASGLENSRNTTVTDPHPALDYARYRIVATSEETGAVSYYDLPPYPVGGIPVVIQWEEIWSSFDTTEEAALEQPAYNGSMLKLPYNIDVSDSHSADVAHVEYIGREHPVSYYGTQLGETATWNVEIDKEDKETLYAIRRLARWMGDVYVREPSGSGYWATISVSFSQKHKELTIPITFNITRVEGGM